MQKIMHAQTTILVEDMKRLKAATGKDQTTEALTAAIELRLKIAELKPRLNDEQVLALLTGGDCGENYNKNTDEKK